MKETRRERELEHLRRLLRRGSLPGRTGDDRSHDARRRVVTGSVIAVAVAALVITPQFLNKSRTTEMRRHVDDVTAGSTASASDQGVDPGSVTPCPQQPVSLPSSGPDGTAIRAEATSIRLCTATVPGVNGDIVDVPLDALTTGAGAFFRTVRDLPPADLHRCDAIRVAARPYVYLVGFSDGSLDRVYVGNSCDDVTVSGVRHPSDAVLHSYLQALEQQRLGAPSDR